MADKVKVRAIRPHDTIYGMKQPGEEYERTATEAQRLTERGIVKAVSTRKPKPPKRK